MKFKNIFSLILVVASHALVSCGGGGGGSNGNGPENTVISVKGVALDGYLHNATVFLDLNGNGQKDAGEPTTITDSGGGYVLNATMAQFNSHSVMVIAQAGVTIDQDYPNVKISSDMTLVAPPGAPTVVSPITTHVSAKMASGLTLEQAKLATQSELGIPASEILADYIKINGSGSDSHKVAVVVSEFIKSNELSTNSNSSLSMKLTGLAKQLEAEIVGYIPQIKQSNSIDDARKIFSDLGRAKKYQISGVVSGVKSPGLIVSDGITSVQVAGSATSFTFPTKLADKSNYNISILSNPSGQSCVILNNSGVINGGDVTDVAVDCKFNPLKISGIVQGLNASGLKITNGIEILTVNKGLSAFEFVKGMDVYTDYKVTVVDQPVGQVCSINNGEGRLALEGANNVQIICSGNYYSLAGNVFGLTSSGLRLKMGAEIMDLNSGQSNFKFLQNVAYGSNYKVEIYSQPNGLTCVPSNATGVMGAADVTSVRVDCAPAAYSVSGQITGSVNPFSSSTAVVSLSVNINGDYKGTFDVDYKSKSFTLPWLLKYRDKVEVAVFNQPVGGSCGLSYSSGEITENRNDVFIRCESTAIAKLKLGNQITFDGTAIKLDASDSRSQDGSDLLYSWNNGATTGKSPYYYLYKDDAIVREYSSMRVANLTVQPSSGGIAGTDSKYVSYSSGVTSTFAGVAGDCAAVDGDYKTARFYGLGSIFVDATGNAYVTDTHRIRKIDVQRNVQTIAGSDDYGYVNGEGLQAKFLSPGPLVVDTTGNIYVFDRNNVIRKIDTSGKVSTFSGSGVVGRSDGNSSTAQFSGSISGMAIDSNNNIYIADAGNHLVRKVTQDGYVSTIAGSTQGYLDGVGANAKFSNLSGLTVDTRGYISVSEFLQYGVYQVRRISPAGNVETIGQGGGGAMTSDDNDNLYHADSSRNSIRLGWYTVVGSDILGPLGAGYSDGPGTIKFRGLGSLAWSRKDGLLITDSGNCVIRKITP